MKKILLLVLTFSFWTSCGQNSTETKKKIDIDYSIIMLINNDSIVKKIVNRLENVFNENDINGYIKYWDKNDFQFMKEPHKDLYLLFNNGYKTYIPTIISVVKTNNKFIVKIAVMGNPEGFNSLYAIYDLGVNLVNGEAFFYNMLNSNLSNFNKKTISNITYFFKDTVNKNQIANQIEFNQYLVKFFQKQNFEFNFIVAKNYEEMLKLQSYNYKDDMYVNSSGGIAYANDKIVFSANNSFYYPHEVVHLFTNKYYPNIHEIIDEGIATYLGGSKEISYNDLKNELGLKVKSYNSDFKKLIFEYDYKYIPLSKGTPIFYVIGAFICEEVYKNKGLRGLEQIMNTGYEDDKKLLSEICKVLEVKENELNDYLLKKLY
ncbi:hypothetical protein [Flavobacterium sp.]|jgi:hypothetical protein|uniref:hypothetical protein n=1 Tax=Flavobacterium sp. TaxID=239 RepID=UPI0037C06739